MHSEILYTALTAEKISSEQTRLIEAVMELVELPSHKARQLLQVMKWNYEKLGELYFENPTALLSKAGCITLEDEAPSQRVERQLSGQKVITDTPVPFRNRLGVRLPCLPTAPGVS